MIIRHTNERTDDMHRQSESRAFVSNELHGQGSASFIGIESAMPQCHQKTSAKERDINNLPSVPECMRVHIHEPAANVFYNSLKGQKGGRLGAHAIGVK